MIYEYCDSELIPSCKCLHVRLSTPGKPGENRWWVCDICGKEIKDCKCLRPVLYKIQLAKLHGPGRRRSIRAPRELQAFWTQFMAGLRMVGVNMQWHPAYLAAVHKALSQDATRLKTLSLFIPGRQRTAKDWEAYTRFLSRLSVICRDPNCDQIRRRTGRTKQMAQLVGYSVK
ncbi:hypothetical protein LZ31DRAFT_596177 [Colletotrichum somersetense]|nr:hypothetical protein LZ31DRAFT_596177 [Colletotrichum somersetense]